MTERLNFCSIFRSLLILIFAFSVVLNTQLEDQRKCSLHWTIRMCLQMKKVTGVTFVILKSDFTELEKYVKALIQLSHKIGVTNDFITKLLKATRKVL